MTRTAFCGNFKLRFEQWPVTWMWPISLVLMQATLLRIGDFSVTVAVIACHLLQLHLVMLYWLRRPPHWQVTIALVILAVSLGAGAFARDLTEFLRSFAHVSNAVLMVLICLNVRIGAGEEVGRSFSLFCLLACAVALVIVIQALSFNLWRDFRLAGLLRRLRAGRAWRRDLRAAARSRAAARQWAVLGAFGRRLVHDFRGGAGAGGPPASAWIGNAHRRRLLARRNGDLEPHRHPRPGRGLGGLSAARAR